MSVDFFGMPEIGFLLFLDHAIIKPETKADKLCRYRIVPVEFGIFVQSEVVGIEMRIKDGI